VVSSNRVSSLYVGADAEFPYDFPINFDNILTTQVTSSEADPWTWMVDRSRVITMPYFFFQVSTDVFDPNAEPTNTVHTFARPIDRYRSSPTPSSRGTIEILKPVVMRAVLVDRRDMVRSPFPYDFPLDFEEFRSAPRTAGGRVVILNG
jgi:hypothetical protein